MEQSQIAGESKEQLKNFMNEIEVLKSEMTSRYGSKVEKLLRANKSKKKVIRSDELNVE